MEREKLSRELQMLPISAVELNEGQLEGLPKNPRSIKKTKYEKLKRNIEQYPEMLAWRSLLVYPLDNGHYIIIGGNMRYRVMQELGHKEVPCVIIPKETSVEQLQAYTIIDNGGFGEWDWDLLANEWDEEWLVDWGVDLGGIGIGPDNAEIDLSQIDDVIQLKLQFSKEQYDFVMAKLRETAASSEAALLDILGYGKI